jgi:hypothetical protein
MVTAGPGQVRHGTAHDFRFLFEEPDALVRFPQLRGVIGHDPGFHAVFSVCHLHPAVQGSG